MSNFISLSEGIEMTTAFRNNKDTILKSAYAGQNILANSETFSKADVETLLAKDGCEKLRIYSGMDANLQVHAILVAVDADNKDILPAANSLLSSEEEEDYLLERGQRCPTICPEDSPLNG